MPQRDPADGGDIGHGHGARRQAFGQEQPRRRRQHDAVSGGHAEPDDQHRRGDEPDLRHQGESRGEEDRQADAEKNRIARPDAGAEPAPADRRRHGDEGHAEKNVTALRQPQAVDIVQIGSAPQRLHRHHRRVGDQRNRQKQPDLGVGEQLDRHDEGRAQTLAARVSIRRPRRVASGRVAHEGERQQDRDDIDPRDDEETFTPTDPLGRRRQGRGRQQGADIADRNHDGDHLRKALRRIPAREQHHGAKHQRRRAQPHEEARHEQPGHRLGIGEHDRTDAKEAERHRIDDARPVAVEEDPVGKLHRRMGKEEHPGQQPQRFGGNADLAHQVGRQHRDRAAQELTEDGREPNRRDQPDGDGKRRHAGLGWGHEGLFLLLFGLLVFDRKRPAFACLSRALNIAAPPPPGKRRSLSRRTGVPGKRAGGPARAAMASHCGRRS